MKILINNDVTSIEQLTEVLNLKKRAGDLWSTVGKTQKTAESAPHRPRGHFWVLQEMKTLSSGCVALCVLSVFFLPFFFRWMTSRVKEQSVIPLYVVFVLHGDFETGSYSCNLFTLRYWGSPRRGESYSQGTLPGTLGVGLPWVLDACSHPATAEGPSRTVTETAAQRPGLGEWASSRPSAPPLPSSCWDTNRR